jgi:hypothetical protein
MYQVLLNTGNGAVNMKEQRRCSSVEEHMLHTSEALASILNPNKQNKENKAFVLVELTF